jgi:methylated-DNA-[protein]-cysteine S-methyltransferase
MCAALWTQKLRDGLPANSTPRNAASEAPQRGPRPDDTAVTSHEPAAPATERALAYKACESSFGVIHLAASADGICGVSLYETEQSFRARLGAARWDLPGAEPLLAQAAAQIAEYVAGRRQAFDVPLDLRSTTPFDRRVLGLIAAIPSGATRTYGELAHELGSPGAARAVGRACGRNPVPLLIPCHRVVRAGGSLAGFGAGGPDVKARLLALERGAR